MQTQNNLKFGTAIASIAVLFLQASANAQVTKANSHTQGKAMKAEPAKAKFTQSTFSIVGIVAANPAEWDTTAGRIKVQGHLLEVIELKNGKTNNPVKFRVGFEFDGKKRMDVKHLSGNVMIDVTPLIPKPFKGNDSKSSSLAFADADMMNRRVVDVTVGQNEVELDLPPGDYRASIIASNREGSGGNVSSTVNFTVEGEYDPKRVPKLMYKPSDQQKPK